MNDSLVIIPTYNERENVVRMLETVMGLEFPFDVLVVDDDSPDGTAALVKECQVAHPDRIHLLEREGKLGLGTAYIAGFRWALERGYDFIFEMDCDFSHDPHDLVRLRIPCRGRRRHVCGLALRQRRRRGQLARQPTHPELRRVHLREHHFGVGRPRQHGGVCVLPS